MERRDSVCIVHAASPCCIFGAIVQRRPFVPHSQYPDSSSSSTRAVTLVVFLTNRLEFRRLRSLIRRIWWAMINWILGDALAEIFSIDPRYHFPVEIVLLKWNHSRSPLLEKSKTSKSPFTLMARFREKFHGPKMFQSLKSLIPRAKRYRFRSSPSSLAIRLTRPITSDFGREKRHSRAF